MVTSLVDRITAVLREHSSLDDDEWDRCACGEPTQPGGWAAHVAEQIAELPIVLIDTDDDGDPFYAYQEEMTHIAKADRVTYGQWIKRELGAAWSAVEDAR